MHKPIIASSSNLKGGSGWTNVELPLPSGTAQTKSSDHPTAFQTAEPGTELILDLPFTEQVSYQATITEQYSLPVLPVAWGTAVTGIFNLS
jgi:hypothetical protein